MSSLRQEPVRPVYALKLLLWNGPVQSASQQRQGRMSVIRLPDHGL